MDLLAATKDFHEILGFLASLGRGPPHDHQQVQHVPSACSDGRYYTCTCRACCSWESLGNYAVSYLFFMLCFVDSSGPSGPFGPGRAVPPVGVLLPVVSDIRRYT